MTIEDQKCVACSGQGHVHAVECGVCKSGVIPADVMEFIEQKMKIEGNHYQCHYMRMLNENGTNVIEISFRLTEHEFRLFGLHTGPNTPVLPTNTVDLIRYMNAFQTKGIYSTKKI